jgi:hypothetical protein
MTGVYGTTVLDASKSFKQEALLFHEIVIPELDWRLDHHEDYRGILSYIDSYVDNLYWLRDVGILRNAAVEGIPSLRELTAMRVDEDGSIHSALAEVRAEEATPVDELMAVADDQLESNTIKRLMYAAAARGWRANMFPPVASRVISAFVSKARPAK